MSHFTVLVIGEDVEGQLQPYHEFECTGTNDEFVQDIDITEEINKRITEKGETLNDALGYHGLEDRIVRNESEIDRDGRHKFGFAVISQKSTLIRAVDRTNKNAKWDWWSIGGRWTGYFRLKYGAEGEVGEPGIMTPKAKAGEADQAKKKDIDFETMRRAAEERAAKIYDAVARVIDGTPECESWDSVRERFTDIEAAREFYRTQERAAKFIAFSNSKEGMETIGWRQSVEEFCIPRDQYLRAARDEAIQTFAVVKDGKWYEKGKMGWFACVSGEKDPETWTAMFNQLIESASEETMLTVVDCHI